MNKTQTNKSGMIGGQAVESVGSKPARRLGRGLSSLLGTPVKVEVDSGLPGPTAPAKAVTDRAAVSSEAVGAPGAAIPATVRIDAGPAGRAGEGSGGVVMIPVGEIVPNRHQPRRKFEEGALAQLAASIRAAGVVQPVLVRKVTGVTEHSERNTPTITGLGAEQPKPAAQFELVAGERRWRAAQLAGLLRVPAVIADLSDEQAAEWALIENVQRTDLSAMETGYAVRELCERFKLTHAQAAEKLGLDRTSITNLVRLTELEPEVREMLEQGTLSAGHGKVLLGMAAGMRRASLAKRAMEAGWSVRRLSSAVSLMMKGASEDASGEDALRAAAQLGQADAGKGGLARDSLAHAGMRELEKQLGEHLGTKVQIKVRLAGKRGSLKIEFYDLDHFDGLMAKMGFVME